MKAFTIAALLATPAAARDLAITDVTVFDTRTGALSPHRTVVVHDGRIGSIGTGPAPRGASLLRGMGKFLIPGLWDFVTHVSWTRASALPVPASLPRAGEVLIRVEAAGAAFGDVLLRRGVAGGRFPVTPGYDLVGVVEALGPGAERFRVGDRVAAFPGKGGQQERIRLPETDLLAVPPGVEVDKAAATILNYLTAYQLMTRAVPLARGQTAFVYGLAGGLGGAMRQVAAQLGVRLHGTASASRLAQAREGATAYDRGDPAWPRLARRDNPEGFDAVFDPLGGASLHRSHGLLSRRGTLVMIGAAASVQGGRSPRLALVETLARFAWLKLRPGSRRARMFFVEGAGKQPERFRRELGTLFAWLAAGMIDPPIHAVLPLADARAAQAMLERSEAGGKIILKA